MSLKMEEEEEDNLYGDGDGHGHGGSPSSIVVEVENQYGVKMQENGRENSKVVGWFLQRAFYVRENQRMEMKRKTQRISKGFKFKMPERRAGFSGFNAVNDDDRDFDGMGHVRGAFFDFARVRSFELRHDFIKVSFILLI